MIKYILPLILLVACSKEEPVPPPPVQEHFQWRNSEVWDEEYLLLLFTPQLYVCQEYQFNATIVDSTTLVLESECELGNATLDIYDGQYVYLQEPVRVGWTDLLPAEYWVSWGDNGLWMQGTHEQYTYFVYFEKQ